MCMRIRISMHREEHKCKKKVIWASTYTNSCDFLKISEVNPTFLFQETEVIDLDNVLKRFLKGNLGLL